MDDIEFVRSLTCACRVGRKGFSGLCPCKVVAAKFFRNTVIKCWYLGENIRGYVSRTVSGAVFEGDDGEADMLPMDADGDLDIVDDVRRRIVPRRSTVAGKVAGKLAYSPNCTKILPGVMVPVTPLSSMH